MTKEIPFNTMLKDIESVVRKLEGGELTLEDSLKAYEEGVGLTRKAQKRLADMEGKIEILTKDGTAAPFETNA